MNERLGWYCLLAVLLVFAGFRRNSVWHDDVVLWQDAVLKSPENERALDNYCEDLYTVSQQYEEALTICTRAVKARPEEFDPHLNLGRIYSLLGRKEEASREFLVGSKLLNKTDDAYAALGDYLVDKGMLDDAVIIYETALVENPSSARIHCSLAALQEKIGKKLQGKNERHLSSGLTGGKKQVCGNGPNSAAPE